MINRVQLNRASVIIGVFLLTACAKPPILVNNAESNMADKAKTTKTIEINNTVRVSVLDGFRVSSGPKEFDTKQGETEQALLSVFDEPNQLVCQVAARLFAQDETRNSAMNKLRIKSDALTLDSTKSLASGAVESTYRVIQSSGVELSFYERAYFLEADESIYDLPIGYRIFCATETKRFSVNQRKIDEYFDLIKWL